VAGQPERGIGGRQAYRMLAEADSQNQKLARRLDLRQTRAQFRRHRAVNQVGAPI